MGPKTAAAFAALALTSGSAGLPAALSVAPLPEGWRMESAPDAIPGVGTYTLALPPAMEKVPVTGIASSIAEYRSPALTLLFDFGAHRPAPPSCRGKVRCTIGSLDVHGGRASRLRYFHSDPDGGLPYRAAYEIPFAPQPRRISLIVSVECASASACDLVDRIVRTIEILPGR